jgi:hypothetical protein
MSTPLEDLEPRIIELQRMLEAVQDALYAQIWSTTDGSHARQTLETAHDYISASADTLEQARGTYAGALVNHRLGS